MSDLIYRKDAIRETWKEPTYSDPLNVLTEMRDRLEALPFAEPERKKGKWIIYVVSLLDGEDVKCSECGQCGCAPYWNFCPNCGAEMTEVENETD